MRESFVGYIVSRVGPCILAGSIVGCIIAGEIGPVHAVLVALGPGLIALGGYRQRAAVPG